MTDFFEISILNGVMKDTTAEHNLERLDGETVTILGQELIFNADVPKNRYCIRTVCTTFRDLPLLLDGSIRRCGCNAAMSFR